MELYTAPPADSTVICADELGPVIPRTFPPAPGWSPDGHRVKAPLEYSRGPEKTWVYGGLRVADGHEVTMCAPSRNSSYYQRFLQQVEDANPHRQIVIITGNLSSHDSKGHPGLAGGSPPHPARLHPQGLLLAEPSGRLVADLPQGRPGRAVLRRPRRDRPRHPGGHRPAQRPRPALDLGTTPAQATRLPPTLYIHPLRNVAPSRLPEFFQEIQDAFTQAGDEDSVFPIRHFYQRWGAAIAIERRPSVAARLHAAERALADPDPAVRDQAVREAAEIVQAAYREVAGG